jgi:hypothetical protein
MRSRYSTDKEQSFNAQSRFPDGAMSARRQSNRAKEGPSSRVFNIPPRVNFDHGS